MESFFGEIDGTGFEILKEEFHSCLTGHGRIERLWTGARWVEGPVWFPAGRFLVFSDIPNNRMLRWDETNGHVSEFRNPSNFSNGNTRDLQARLITCQHLSRSVTRTEHSGEVTTLASHYDGKLLNSPNDVIVKRDGSIWFTDPDYGIMSDYEGRKSSSEQSSCNVFRIDQKTGNIDLSQTMPELKAYQDGYENSIKLDDKGRAVRKDTDSVQGTTGIDQTIYVLNSVAQIITKGVIGGEVWTGNVLTIPNYKNGLSKIYLNREGIDAQVVGTVAVNEANPFQLLINWDEDTIPTDTVIVGPITTSGSVDFIVDPTKFDPSTVKQNGKRLLLLKGIGDSDNEDGADAWKGDSNIDLVAGANDIIEWNGTNWEVIFDASTTTDLTHVTNLNTGVQYKWNGSEWLLSFEGEYRKGTWKIQ